MIRQTLVVVSLGACVFAAACGKNTPSAAPTPPAARVIRLGGNLNFGDVQVGDVRTDGLLIITNDGNAALTVSGITVPSGGAHTPNWTSGTIAPGASQTVGIRFAPTAVQSYSGMITVNGDQTNGTNSIATVGAGVPIPIRLLASSLPAGSTVPVAPLSGSGQQATQLSFTAAITLDRDLPNGLVQAFVRTPTLRCLGGGRLTALQRGREQVVTPGSMSNSGPGSGQALCTLPYDTTIVEILVLDGQTVVQQQQFPVVYHFVRSP